MADDFLKGLLVGGLVASGPTDKRTVDELHRQTELAREEMRREEKWRDWQADQIREQAWRDTESLQALGDEFANRLDELTGMCRQLRQELQAVRGKEEQNAATTNSKFSEMLAAVGKVDRRIRDIGRLLIHRQMAASPLDPRYLVDRFSPSQLYEEYLSSGCALSTNDFVLPPSWLNYLETEFARPTGHCLFVCPDFEAINRLVEILSKEQGDGIRRLVAETPEDLPGLVGLFTRLVQGDLLVLVDRHGFLAPELEACLAEAINNFMLEIKVDKGPTANTVRLTLPQFSCYFVTVNATSSTNILSALFRREVSLASLVRIHQASCVGQIAMRHDLNLDYSTASALLAAAKRLNLVPDVFAQRMCGDHPDWVRELAAGRITADDLITRCR